jgi:hypothetical protein
LAKNTKPLSKDQRYIKPLSKDIWTTFWLRLTCVTFTGAAKRTNKSGDERRKDHAAAPRFWFFGEQRGAGPAIGLPHLFVQGRLASPPPGLIAGLPEEPSGQLPEGFLAADMSMWRDEDYWSARREHAVRLRAEGLTLSATGVRLGVTRERVRQMVARFERQARLAEEHFREADITNRVTRPR